MGVSEVVFEASGRFTKRDDVRSSTIESGGAKRVVITLRFRENLIITVVLGVNQDAYDPRYIA